MDTHDETGSFGVRCSQMTSASSRQYRTDRCGSQVDHILRAHSFTNGSRMRSAPTGI